MDDEQAYRDQLDKDIAAAQKRVSDGVAASNFLETSEGKLIQDWINMSVSRELDKMTAKVPMTDEEYLESHGAVRVLKEFNVMLQSKAAVGTAAQAEVEALNEQRAAITDTQA